MNLHTASNPDRPLPSGIVIQLDNVSVKYRLPHERITSFKEYAIRRIKRTLVYNDFLALKNMSLTVQRGEVLGIIGHNGAGKSTLLKVIARVLRPSNGRVQVRGRVAPLLELGTGFDFELTGRENIFLNSAMLGYSQHDTESRVSNIIDFAGLGNFIDAPLRTYSSGMVARLGFAVATDIRPEILIVDELLSVGDAEFRSRAEARMKSFQNQQATILIVSHNLGTITEMCQRVIWMEAGEVKAEGNPRQIVHEYELSVRKSQSYSEQ